MNKLKYTSMSLLSFFSLLAIHNFILLNFGELESNIFLSIVILLIGIALNFTKHGQILLSFIKSSFSEIKIISWLPINKSLILATKVLVIIIISTIIIFLMDNINTYIIEKTILKG